MRDLLMFKYFSKDRFKIDVCFELVCKTTMKSMTQFKKKHYKK